MESLGRRNTVRTQMKALAPKSKLAVDITLNDHQHDAFVSSYTTLDRIEGEVSITAPSDTRFDDILITFEGMNHSLLVYSLVPRSAHFKLLKQNTGR